VYAELALDSRREKKAGGESFPKPRFPCFAGPPSFSPSIFKFRVLISCFTRFPSLQALVPKKVFVLTQKVWFSFFVRLKS
jgi:hypothetical protein